MGLRIELEEIWRRLQTRFKARLKTDTDPEDPDHPVLIETVQPITNIDELLQSPDIVTGTHDISSGASTVVATVPLGKKWHPRLIRKGATAGTVITILEDPAGHQIYLASGATAAVNIFGADLADVVMDEGWKFALDNGAGGDTAITFAYYIIEEDAF